MTDTPTIKHQTYAIGFRVSQEMLQDDANLMCRILLAQAAEAQATKQDLLARGLWEDISGQRPAHSPPTRLQRLRRWLGRKLWDWGTRLDPDLLDY